MFYSLVLKSVPPRHGWLIQEEANSRPQTESTPTISEAHDTKCVGTKKPSDILSILRVSVPEKNP